MDGYTCTECFTGVPKYELMTSLGGATEGFARAAPAAIFVFFYFVLRTRLNFFKKNKIVKHVLDMGLCLVYY